MSVWVKRAACRNYDPELFFPKSGQHGDEARAICRACPVMVNCLFFALGNPWLTQAGIWAATSAEDRARMRAWDRRVRSQRSAGRGRDVSHAEPPPSGEEVAYVA